MKKQILFATIAAAIVLMLHQCRIPVGYAFAPALDNHSKARDLPHLSTSAASLTVPNTQQKVHDVGNIWLLVSNYGYFGNETSSEYDRTVNYPFFISCQFPAYSFFDYLYQGALWVGAITSSDTLVSYGGDGWAFQGERREMFPGFTEADTIEVQSARPGSPFFYEDAISEQDFIAVYTDTLLSSDYSGVSINHLKPLYLEIVQRSYAWSYSYAEDFILFDYLIRNIGLKQLNDIYIAIYLDGDCGPTPYDYDSGHRRAQDDITGFREYTDDSVLVNIAWLADYEGEPGGDTDDDALAPGVMGIRVVRAPNPVGRTTNLLDITYNWWLSDTNAEKDWGPGTCFPDGLCGTPDGDVNKYLVMSNWSDDPRDPDQLDASRGGSPIGAEDTRFLLSFGPFMLSPGDSLPFTLGYMCGENFYRNGNKYDIDFTDIEINAKWVQFVYDNPNVDTDGDGFYGEDVGLDGLYIGDYGYTGPDIDGTESNGRLDRDADGGYPEDLYLGVDEEGGERFAAGRFGYNNGILDEGDGIPDFKGPPPPPSPQLRVEVESDEVILYWDDSPEAFDDPFITTGDSHDFAGYRVYKSFSGVISDYILLADLPLGSSAFESATMSKPDTMVSGADTTIYRYEYHITPVMSNWPLYVAVTSYDRGYEPLNLASLESSVNYNATAVIPSTSIEDVKSKGVQVVPNPYRIDQDYAAIWWEEWENKGQNWTEFSRRIDFCNLPGRCKVRIFTLTGDLVATVYNREDDTIESWDVLSKDIQSITSGIYLFSVEPVEGGEIQIGKFVIIK
jgi:hypothetical protein